MKQTVLYWSRIGGKLTVIYQKDGQQVRLTYEKLIPSTCKGGVQIG